MDGIDISLVKTNGINLKRSNKNYFYKYSIETRNFLLNLLNQDINFILKRKKILDELITDEHYKALKYFEIINKCDLIGFHGQTIFHFPAIKCSLQLGDPAKLAKLCNKDVVFEFRAKDIHYGGQGAPLAPIYHKLIIEDHKLELPSCILNIGGVANITYWDGKSLIGFDTGPGNALMDNFMKKTTNNFFDKNGNLASQGVAEKKILKRFLNHKFFKKKPPKSLDRNSFLNFYDELTNADLKIPDTMSTLAEFTIESICLGIKRLPQKVKTIIIAGGGCRNNYLMKCLTEKLDIKFISENDTYLNFDYIESELIAFLAARSLYNLPITFPSTTGVSKPLPGGKLQRYL